VAQEAAGPAHGEPTADEERLVPRMIAYQAGRLDAFEALYLALADDVRRFFAASVLEPSAAHDLAQQTFLELHRARHTYRPPRPVRPWVFGIAVNVRRRHRREAMARARREAMARARREADAPAVMAGASGPSPDVVGTVAVQRALEQIPAGRRHAWILHHVHGFSFEEIGARLGIGAGAAKLRSSRAMRGLRALLAGDRERDDE
jgi:RNA polymerase sigma-70 factor, ECF subfamily